jgi:hypothetical protein
MDEPKAAAEKNSAEEKAGTDPSELGFYELIRGAQVRFSVPQVPPTPERTRAIEQESLRQRAEDAWRSSVLLKEAISLWGYFLVCGFQGTRIDAATGKDICRLFPELKDFGAVLDAFTSDAKLTGASEVERRRLSKLARIKRGPTKRCEQPDSPRERGRKLCDLIKAFRTIIETHARCLALIGVRTPLFQQPVETLVAEISKIARVDLDFTSGAPPLDFGRKLGDQGYTVVSSTLWRELETLQALLETSPRVVIEERHKESAGSEETPENTRRRRRRGRPHDPNVAKRTACIIRIWGENRAIKRSEIAAKATKELGEEVTVPHVANALKKHRADASAPKKPRAKARRKRGGNGG